MIASLRNLSLSLGLGLLALSCAATTSTLPSPDMPQLEGVRMHGLLGSVGSSGSTTRVATRDDGVWQVTSIEVD